MKHSPLKDGAEARIEFYILHYGIYIQFIQTPNIKQKQVFPWLSVHKEVLVSRIKIPYAFLKKPHKATALHHFLASA